MMPLHELAHGFSEEQLAEAERLRASKASDKEIEEACMRLFPEEADQEEQ